LRNRRAGQSTRSRAVQWGPAQLVAGGDGLLQEAHKFVCFAACQAAQHGPLGGLDHWGDATQSSPSRNSDGQFAGSPVPAAFLARNETFRDQPVHHPGDGGAVKGNQSGKGDLIDAGVGPDSGECRVLDGREVVTCLLDLSQEHSHRYLLEAAR